MDKITYRYFSKLLSYLEQSRAQVSIALQQHAECTPAMFTGFDWDEKKNIKNKSKHGVRFEDCIEVFTDTNRVILEDFKHSNQEDRFYCIGKCKLGIVTVRFTFRENSIRIFGAGKWRKGKKIYEEKYKENNL